MIQCLVDDGRAGIWSQRRPDMPRSAEAHRLPLELIPAWHRTHELGSMLAQGSPEFLTLPAWAGVS